MTTPETMAPPSHLEHSTPQSIIKKLISFPAMLAVLLVAGMQAPLRQFWVDPDVWWHIKVGSVILSTHRWPTTDPYSFTAYGTHWIAYQWLGEVLLAMVSQRWGLRGLLALDIGMAGAILSALFALITIRCQNSKAAFATCTLFLPLVYASCSLRPQMLAYFFLVLTLIILERFRQGHTRALWLLPPLFLVWVNTHGLFVLGLFALGVYWVCGLVEIRGLESRLWTVRERLQLEMVALLSLVALVITPYGSELLLYPLDLALSQPIMQKNIIEWAPMMFDKVFGQLFLALILAFLLAQVTLRPRWRLEEFVLFLAGITAACLHVRFVLAFVPFSAPMFAVIISRWFDPYEPAKDKYALNAGLMGLAVAATLWFFPSRAALEQVVEEKWPVKAVAYLRQHPVPKPMYNDYLFGGYLIWQLADQNKVFIDGRADIYERTGVLSDYLSIGRLASPTPLLLEAYNLKSCLVKQSEPLQTLLTSSPAWEKVYADEQSVLFVRKPASAGKPQNVTREVDSSHRESARGSSH